jgi:outer membrane lipoprotein-sorting protein
MRSKVLIFLALGVAGTALGAQVTGDAVLALMRDKWEVALQGDMAVAVTVTVRYPDGYTEENRFTIFSRPNEGEEPDKLLVYFLAPEELQGTIYLVWANEETRLWMYLPALGVVRELVTEGAQAPMGLPYGETVGAFDYTQDFSATVVGEEDVPLTDTEELRPTWVLELRAKEGAPVDWSHGRMWVDQEALLPLKASLWHAEDRRETLSVASLTTFEGELFPGRGEMVLEDGTKTTVHVEQLWRAEFPAEIFAPEGLLEFDPAAYGLAVPIP